MKGMDCEIIQIMPKYGNEEVVLHAKGNINDTIQVKIMFWALVEWFDTACKEESKFREIEPCVEVNGIIEIATEAYTKYCFKRCIVW